MDWKTLLQRALQVRQHYAEFERKHYGRPWTSQEIALGLVGDVGDLVKLVMAEGGRRNIPDARRRLAHELADCLWSVMVLAHMHDVDLEQAFLQTMDELEGHITSSVSSE